MLNRFTILRITFLTAVIHIQASTFYVDRQHTSASNANPGSVSRPFLTIQHGIDSAQPGDSVIVRAGIYGEFLSTVRNGGINRMIVLAGYPGEAAVLSGADGAASTGLRILHDYIRISGLHIRDWDAGIWAADAAFFTISDCEISEIWFGIGIADGSHDFEINHVEIHHFNLYGFDASPSGGASCYNGVLNNCLSHTCRDPEQNVDGFAVGHGEQNNFTFNNCETWDVYDGFDISARNTSLNACSAHECGWGGYKIWQDSVKLVNCLGYNNDVVNVELDWSGSPKSVFLQNCTFYDGHVYNVTVENPLDTLHMANCILAGGENIGLLIAPNGHNYQADYNLFQCDNGPRTISTPGLEYDIQQIRDGLWASACGQDAHSAAFQSTADIFTDTVLYDFRPAAESPAIDAGYSGFGERYDFNGNPRISGSRVDIGAFEYQAGTSVLSGSSGTDRNQVCAVFPNPANGTVQFKFISDIEGPLHIRFYNARGQAVKTAGRQLQSAMNAVSVPVDELSGGTYFYLIMAPNDRISGKFVLIK